MGLAVSVKEMKVRTFPTKVKLASRVTQAAKAVVNCKAVERYKNPRRNSQRITAYSL